MESHADSKGSPSISEIQRSYGAVRIDGNLRQVKLTVKIYKSGESRNYSYELAEIEILGYKRGAGTSEEAITPRPSISFVKLLEGFRKNNGEPFDPAFSQVLDKNVEPLMILTVST